MDVGPRLPPPRTTASEDDDPAGPEIVEPPARLVPVGLEVGERPVPGPVVDETRGTVVLVPPSVVRIVSLRQPARVERATKAVSERGRARLTP